MVRRPGRRRIGGSPNRPLARGGLTALVSHFAEREHPLARAVWRRGELDALEERVLNHERVSERRLVEIEGFGFRRRSDTDQRSVPPETIDGARVELISQAIPPAA